MIRRRISLTWLAIGSALFLATGALLFKVCYPNERFTDELLIYDLIRLDIWSLGFLGILLLTYFARLGSTARSWGIVIALSVWGAVTTAIFFHGTVYGLNGYGGDQAFRIAMILKFETFAVPGDFYYRGLPPFYPPVLYWLNGLIARIFSINAYHMIKVGTVLLYLCSPVALFLLWKKVVTETQAAIVTLFCVVFASFGKAPAMVAPHAFLANSLFIPWWFYFIERVGIPKASRLHYLAGGLIGALLFMTYYYPFFIGGLLLTVRLVFGQRVSFLSATKERFSWTPAITTLALSALFSSIYWGPLLYSYTTIGYDSAQQEWHHMGSPGIGFEFVQFTIAGLSYCAALLFAVRRNRAAVYRGFLLFIGTVFLFHLIGSILGVFDKPVNLIKAGEFIALAGGPLIGLVAANLLGRARMSVPRSLVGATLVLIVLLAMIHEISGFAKQPMVRTARTTGVPTFGLDKHEMESRTGSVFLTNEEKLFSFYPVYAFYAINQHYSHPAARLEQRLALLEALQSVTDPYLFNLALRANQYDSVAFFMPGLKDDKWEFVEALSNYPNKYRHVYYHYDTLLTADTNFFTPLHGPHLFAVRAPASPPMQNVDLRESDELLQKIASHLTAAGRKELVRYSGRSF